MTDIITLKNICNKACHPLPLLQETINDSIKKANKSTKTQSLNYFENFCRIARKYDLIPDNCLYKPNNYSTDDQMKNHHKCKTFQAWTDGSKSDNGTGFGIILKSKRASTSHKFKLNDCHSNNTAEIISIIYTQVIT